MTSRLDQAIASVEARVRAKKITADEGKEQIAKIQIAFATVPDSGGATKGDTVITTEDSITKANRAVEKEVGSLIGIITCITLSPRFISFITAPETYGKWASHRIMEIVRSDGVEDNSPGRIAWKTISEAKEGEPLEGFDGDEPCTVIGRWYVWKMLCRFLAIYTVFYNEKSADKPFDQKQRLKLEEEYLEQVLDPMGGGQAGAATAQKMAAALKSADSAKATIKKTMNRDDSESSSEEEAEDAPPKKKTPSGQPKEDLNKNGIPKGFETWLHAKKIAWLKPLGLCRTCAEKGQKVKGLSENHDKDKHESQWSKKEGKDSKPGGKKGGKRSK